MKLHYLLFAGALALAACGGEQTAAPADDAADPVVEDAGNEQPSENVETGPSAEERLDAVLAAQSDETKARYQYRNPKETLQFFGVEPGMTVVDSLPGVPGWYAPILISYLGAEGRLIGADYSMDMWPLFGGFATEEWIENRRNWQADYVASAEELRGDDSASVSAFVYGSAPEELAGTVDVVLMIRAAHHLHRFEDDGGFFTEALGEVQSILKPGGVVGVVQHRAPDGNSDEWADGSAGYVKQDAIVAAFEAAGFEFVEASEINANPNDQPTEEDIVWRLPPTLGASEEDPELRAQMEAIGESDRMTLKFRKP